jgi:DNA-binding transcriptional LysR family regulator
MDWLSNISVFLHVAKTRSFTEAGRLLGVSSSAVGKSIARLEERLETRLFHRSTRSITLTAEGASFLERCRRIVAEAEAAEFDLCKSSNAPRGKLRVSLPQVHGLVIRTGSPGDSRLVARSLGQFRLVLVGTPEYFRERGVPQAPADLANHGCLRHTFHNTGKFEHWPLRRAVDAPEPLLPTRFVSTSIEAVDHAVRSGLGIACLPDFMVREAVARGELQQVLDEHLEHSGTFWLLWPASRHTAAKLRVFIDHLCARLFPANRGQ